MVGTRSGHSRYRRSATATRRVARVVAVVALGGGIVVAVPTVAAASFTFTVNSTQDAPDANPGDGVCSTQPLLRLGVCTLRAAIMETNANIGADTINLAAATYNLTHTGSLEDLSATGDLDITSPVTINGNGAVIDGQSADRVFEIFPFNLRERVGSNNTLSNLTIRNGKPPECCWGGGGIFVRDGARLTLSGVTVTNNASGVGGGIAANPGSTVTLNGSTVSGNDAYVSGGFGGYMGGIGSDGSLTVTNSTISGNHAVSYAAGIYADGSVTMTGSTVDGNILLNPTGTSQAAGVLFQGTTLSIDSSTISNNVVQSIGGSGGGLEVSGSGTVSNSAIFGNSAFESAGFEAGFGTWHFTGDDVHDNHADANAGGISVNGSSVAVTLDGSTVRGNTAGYEGGGIAVANGASLAITGSSISGNVAGTPTTTGFGGGITTSFPGTATLSVSGSTIDANHATGDGGGVYNGHDATFTNTTLSGNTADHRGGALYNSASLTIGSTTVPLAGSASLSSTTIADNDATDGAGVFNDPGRPVTIVDSLLHRNVTANCSGTITSAGHNLDSDSTCALRATGDLSGIDPLLGSLAANGGPTTTQAVAVHSPAIDAGDPAACPATDQRGVARPQDGDLDGTATCDIGAYEFVPPPDLSLTSTASAAAIVAAQPLTYTFDAHDAGPGSANTVTVTIQLPASAMVSSVAPSQGTCSGLVTVTCDLGALAQAGDATVAIVVVPILPGSIVANGSVTGGPVEVDMTNNATVMPTTVTAAPKTKYVTVADDGFTPAIVKPRQNTTVQWDALTSGSTSVADSSGMNLFTSGLLNPPAYYRFTFAAAGSYPVTDALAHASTVAIPMKGAATATVGVPFTVTWSATVAPAGFVFDVQVKPPGGSGFTSWQTATTAKSAKWTPSVAGTYQFHARLRKLAVVGGNCPGNIADACTGWSPVTKTAVS